MIYTKIQCLISQLKVFVRNEKLFYFVKNLTPFYVCMILLLIVCLAYNTINKRRISSLLSYYFFLQNRFRMTEAIPNSQGTSFK